MKRILLMTKYSPAHIKSNSQINEKEHSENVKQKRQREKHTKIRVHVCWSTCMMKVTTKQSARGSLSLSFGFRIKGLYGMGGEGTITNPTSLKGRKIIVDNLGEMCLLSPYIQTLNP
ncbi:hypothetical protein YC2023_077468 [Brassica napus]